MQFEINPSLGFDGTNKAGRFVEKFHVESLKNAAGIAK
jgi:hypothetical protein